MSCSLVSAAVFPVDALKPTYAAAPTWVKRLTVAPAMSASAGLAGKLLT